MAPCEPRLLSAPDAPGVHDVADYARLSLSAYGGEGEMERAGAVDVQRNLLGQGHVASGEHRVQVPGRAVPPAQLHLLFVGIGYDRLVLFVQDQGAGPPGAEVAQEDVGELADTLDIPACAVPAGQLDSAFRWRCSVRSRSRRGTPRRSAPATESGRRRPRRRSL